MPNIWKQQKDVNNHPKRNNHDLSKKSNISMKMGTLYPVYCKRVYPGDSFSIDTAYNLKLMPVIFPVQTKMRAHMHYFYVRNKNLWTGWQDWISGLRSNSETPHPWIERPDSEFKTGSIHDFLNVPTTIVSRNSQILSSPFSNYVGDAEEGYILNPLFTSYSAIQSAISTRSVFSLTSNFSSTNNSLYCKLSNQTFAKNIRSSSRVIIDQLNASYGSNGTISSFAAFFSAYDYVNDTEIPFLFVPVSFDASSSYLSFDITDEQIELINSFASSSYDITFALLINYSSFSATGVPISPAPRIIFTFSESGLNKYEETGLQYYKNVQHLNALPYRAYESIYNAFYRNTVVDPLIVDGRPEYNRYLPNDGDGRDTFEYKLYQRNYELDFLTSALPSPQHGVAPVVGMTALGDITIEDENGITTAHATVDDDGTITDVVLTSPAASVEHSRTAFNIAQVGMNINDFRNTNALQRLLETTIRKGYRYLDNVSGHWNVTPKYNELDMPEFIGGFSRDVQVATVVSQADTLGSDGLALGDYGGYAQLSGGSRHSVRHYCDDYGYIIGIMSVVPTPAYSQLLPKEMMCPDNYLDYYFPEFAEIGYQPISYREVAPLQAYLDSLVDPSKSVDDTFGYQRPNYDLVGDVDEVHGLFRTDFRNYLINRIFDGRPELGRSFLKINPEEVNQIFVDTDSSSDVIIGEIGFSVHTKRPVPRVVIPGLGH